MIRAALRMTLKSSLGLLLIGSSLDAEAKLKTSIFPAENLRSFTVPGEAAEICVIPSHFPEIDYSKKDLENEEALCSIDFRANAAICPKLENTNPGINVHLIPSGISRESLMEKNCFSPNPQKPEKNEAKKIAKYKLSTSCSYAPSLLAYYHFSRILGDIGDVPVAVIRTFSTRDYQTLGKLAMQRISKISEQGGTIGDKKLHSLIDDTWRSLNTSLSSPTTSKKQDQLFTESLGQTYGALQKNPRGEESYLEFFNQPGMADDHQQKMTAKFRDENPIFLKVASQSPLSAIVGGDFTQTNVQTFMQMRDASEMVLLDTLLNQQDRFGNIHYESRYFYQTPNQLDAWGHSKVKDSEKLPQDQELVNTSAVQIKRLVMKDNDCGVAKQNHFRQAQVLERVAHLRPKVYRQLLRLAQVYKQKPFVDFLKRDLLWTDADIKRVGENLLGGNGYPGIVGVLKKNCRDGKLKVDLDIDAHFSRKPIPLIDCETGERK